MVGGHDPKKGFGNTVLFTHGIQFKQGSCYGNLMANVLPVLSADCPELACYDPPA